MKYSSISILSYRFRAQEPVKKSFLLSNFEKDLESNLQHTCNKYKIRTLNNDKLKLKGSDNAPVFDWLCAVRPFTKLK